MTDEEMADITGRLVGDERLADLCALYLPIAKDAVVSRLFPFHPEKGWADVPERHHGATCVIACYLVNRRGAEGEKSHSENGVSRTYESGGIPESYFKGMLPYCGVPR